MKEIYEDLVDFILNTETPKSDNDIETLYRFCLGNKHQLKTAVMICGDLENFKQVYRDVEKYVIETYLKD